jgi:hypothetical protein
MHVVDAGVAGAVRREVAWQDLEGVRFMPTIVRCAETAAAAGARPLA